MAVAGSNMSCWRDTGRRRSIHQAWLMLERSRAFSWRKRGTGLTDEKSGNVDLCFALGENCDRRSRSKGRLKSGSYRNRHLDAVLHTSGKGCRSSRRARSGLLVLTTLPGVRRPRRRTHGLDRHCLKQHLLDMSRRWLTDACLSAVTLEAARHLAVEIDGAPDRTMRCIRKQLLGTGRLKVQCIRLEYRMRE